MAIMTAEGLRMHRCRFDGTVVVRIADRVRLRNGWTGIVTNWTENGVMVQRDYESEGQWRDGFRFMTVEVVDGDITEVITTKN